VYNKKAGPVLKRAPRYGRQASSGQSFIRNPDGLPLAEALQKTPGKQCLLRVRDERMAGRSYVD
jgi:hypothetical protein